ncbi:MAG: DUF2304 domain-containing protein [Lachnospiraceae bacterium]|nr:DUF2304 domain-containing protein [Lachnospiraceae bacterium]
MTNIFRIILLVVSLFTMIFMLKRIRQSKIQIEDSLFWILFAVMVVILGAFPVIADFMAGVIGIYSTVNFIFLFFIFILLIKEFSMTIKISQLENKIKELTQEIALGKATEQHENNSKTYTADSEAEKR